MTTRTTRNAIFALLNACALAFATLVLYPASSVAQEVFPNGERPTNPHAAAVLRQKYERERRHRERERRAALAQIFEPELIAQIESDSALGMLSDAATELAPDLHLLLPSSGDRLAAPGTLRLHDAPASYRSNSYFLLAWVWTHRERLYWMDLWNFVSRNAATPIYTSGETVRDLFADESSLANADARYGMLRAGHALSGTLQGGVSGGVRQLNGAAAGMRGVSPTRLRTPPGTTRAAARAGATSVSASDETRLITPVPVQERLGGLFRQLNELFWRLGDRTLTPQERASLIAEQNRLIHLICEIQAGPR
jgi:hypothetical protein